MTTNNLFQLLITAILSDPTVLEKGLTPRSPLIQSCKNSNYADFSANGFKYIFLFDESLSAWVANTNDQNIHARVINHEQLEFNFSYPLVNGSPAQTTTLQTMIQDPTSTTRHSQQTPTGATLSEYLETVKVAYQEIKSQCPHNIADNVGYLQPRFYIAQNYHILSIASNQISEKTSTICVIKYRDVATGTDRVMWGGTGLVQLLLDANGNPI